MSTSQVVVDDSAQPTSFEQMELDGRLMRALDDLGFETPSEIQAASITRVMAGRDLVGQAQTGTGKTAAFGLPILQTINTNNPSCQALILAPTRELAIQVADAIAEYGKYLKGLRVTCVYGGSSMRDQIRDLKRGAHIVVGTPGRTLDHIRRKTLKLGGVQSFVLDEADEMLRMGFIDDVETILNSTPDDRQVLLFSATMPKQIRRIAEKYLADPVEVSIERKSSTVSTIHQKFWIVKRGMNKLKGLTRLLAMREHDGVIVFVRTRRDTDYIAEALLQQGVSVAKLHGGIDQKTRQDTVEQFRKGLFEVMVTTDVAARGLDVERITHVINFDPPHDSETYVHRIGRTGRAGREGTSVVFLYAKERRWLRNLERDINKRLDDMEMPTERELEERRIDVFKDQVFAEHVQGVESIYQHVIEDLMRDKNMTAQECAAALAKMATSPQGLVEPRAHEPVRESRDRGRDNRNDRDDRDNRGRDSRDNNSDDDGPTPNLASSPDMDLYRINLTREDGVTPKRIIGALMRDMGLPREAVGRIDYYQEYTTVELVKGLPMELVHDLAELEVAHLPIGLTLMTKAPSGKPLRARSGGSRSGGSRDRRDNRRKTRKNRHNRSNRGGGGGKRSRSKRK